MKWEGFIKFINYYAQTERKNQKKLERVHKINFENSVWMRQILVINLYICITFLMYKMLLWQLKIFSTISIFAIKIKLLKKYQKWLLFYQKSSFCTQDFQSFVLPSSSLFFSFLGHCLLYRRSWMMINSKWLQLDSNPEPLSS